MEWLSHVIFAFAYVTGGFTGVLLVVAVLAVAVALTLWLCILRLTDSPGIAFLLTAIAVTASRLFIQPRPQMWSYVALPIVAYFLAAQRREGRKGPNLFWLVPLFIIWCNLHPGFIAGLAIVGIFGIGEAL